MKDSKEKEHRISNLRDMMKNVTNDKNAQDSFEEYDELEDAPDDDYEVIDAEEMIDILSKDYNKYPKEELDVNEEFLFKPGKESGNNDDAVNDKINSEFIIKTKLEDSEFPQEPQKDLDYEEPKSDFSYDDEDFLMEKFDGMLNKNIKGYSIIAWGSLIFGIILIIFSVFLFNFSSPRLVDNVISGETNTSGVIFLLIGLFLIFIGIYKMKVVKTPFEDVVDSIKSVEKDNGKRDKTQEDNIIQKPLANDNKEVKKVGEFDISEFKNKMDNLQSVDDTENTLSDEEEYEKAHLDDESIDDIFAEIEDIDEVPIISVDSKEEK